MKRLLAALITVALLALAVGCAPPPPEPLPIQTTAQQGTPLATMFFSYNVIDAKRLTEYANYFPQAEESLIQLQVTVENTTAYALTMYDSDFTLHWGEDAQSLAWMRDAMDDTMYPAEFSLDAGQAVTYSLLFTVPQAQTNFTLQYTEAYVDAQGQQLTGEIFSVALTA